MTPRGAAERSHGGRGSGGGGLRPAGPLCSRLGAAGLFHHRGFPFPVLPTWLAWRGRAQLPSSCPVMSRSPAPIRACPHGQPTMSCLTWGGAAGGVYGGARGGSGTPEGVGWGFRKHENRANCRPATREQVGNDVNKSEWAGLLAGIRGVVGQVKGHASA